MEPGLSERHILQPFRYSAVLVYVFLMYLQSADFVNKMQILHGRFNFFSESADFVKDLQFAEILNGRFQFFWG